MANHLDPLHDTATCLTECSCCLLTVGLGIFGLLALVLFFA